MRLKIVIDTQSVCIPYEYHGFLQAAIYKALDESKANFYHNVGYESHNRHYKMFVFSDLKGPYYADKKGLYFKDYAKLFVSSLDADFLNQLYIYFNYHKTIQLGNNVFEVIEAEPILNDVKLNNDSEYWIQTLSPVTCYKTDEKKFTSYFHPKSVDFEKSARNNLEAKLLTILDNADDEFFEIEAIQNIKLKPVKYKQMVIEAYSFKMKIHCSDNYLKLLLHCGMGSKNSAGFGMVRLL